MQDPNQLMEPIQQIYDEVTQRDLFQRFPLHPQAGLELYVKDEEWLFFIGDSHEKLLYVAEATFEARWFRHQIYPLLSSTNIAADRQELDERLKLFFGNKNMKYQLKYFPEPRTYLVVIQKLNYAYRYIEISNPVSGQQ
jgi:hypothetical protein